MAEHDPVCFVVLAGEFGSARIARPPRFHPAPDITAYELWRCCVIAPSLRDLDELPADLQRHFHADDPHD